MQYTRLESTPCSKKCSDPSRLWRVNNHSYIGGYYDAVTPELMQEILARGLISVSSEVYRDRISCSSGNSTHNLPAWRVSWWRASAAH